MVWVGPPFFFKPLGSSLGVSIPARLPYVASGSRHPVLLSPQVVAFGRLNMPEQVVAPLCC